MSEIDTRVIAKARIDKALAEIEKAQESLQAACQLLCPISGFVREWESTGKLYDKVKAQWHRVARRARSFEYDLDESAKRCVADGRTL